MDGTSADIAGYGPFQNTLLGLEGRTELVSGRSWSDVKRGMFPEAIIEGKSWISIRLRNI
jgi:hypothetical protein